MVAYSNPQPVTVTTLTAVRCLFALNRECKQLDNRALKTLIYELKDQAIAALYTGGYCVGAVVKDGSWLVCFTFQIENDVFVFHMPLSSVTWEFDEREPNVVHRGYTTRRMTPKECGACVRTVSSWLESVAHD